MKKVTYLSVAELEQQKLLIIMNRKSQVLDEFSWMACEMQSSLSSVVLRCGHIMESQFAATACSLFHIDCFIANCRIAYKLSL